MIKPLIILLFGVITNFASAQNNLQFEYFKLKNCVVEENLSISDTLYNIPCFGRQLLIFSDSKVQMSCNFGNPSSNRYEVVKNRLSIQIIPDSLGKLKDSLLSEISAYCDEQEIWAKKYNVISFSNLPFYKSFYRSDSKTIPTIWSGAERNGDYYLYYINNTLIKIELIEHQGLGALSSFCRQNFVLTNENRELNLTYYVRSIEEVRRILKAYNTK